MKRFLKIVTAFLILAPHLPAAANGLHQKIRIVSFNIAELGEGRHYLTRDEEGIARILHRLDPDLIAIQEVGVGKGGGKQVRVITSYLNQLARARGKPPYCSIVSRFRTGDERYAFIWRSPVEKISAVKPMEDTEVYRGSIFVRRPVYCYFRARDFDFYLMNVHLYTRIQKGGKGRLFEYRQLRNWLKAMLARKEKDYIVVGDFNRHLDGKDFPRTRAWKVLAFDGFRNLYRFVLLEAIPGGVNVARAPEDRYSTTETKRLAIYDQILISKGAYREFGEKAVWQENVGILDFDNDPKYAGISTRKLKYIISDHRPIWADFRIDLGDDD